MSTCWSADHLRVSLFKNDVWTEQADSVYTEIFGGVPESITSKPNANESSAQGSWEGLRIDVNRAFNRFDFILQEVPSEALPVPLINDIQIVLPKLTAAVFKWASLQPRGIVRIAIGCNALLQSDSAKDGYIKLKELIKVIPVDVDRFREFRFQVNLPVVSETYPEITINRLTSWAAIILRAGLLSPNKNNFFDDKYYVNCSLDINTDGERSQAIDNSLIDKLLNEMSSICISILDEGIS